MSIAVSSFTTSQFAVHRMKLLYELFENNEATDAHFVFTENGQSKKISAHKIILAADSPVFKAMFYGALKEKGDVKMIDESSVSFEVFLKAIYQQFEPINMGNISEVMSLADKYDTKDVMDFCGRFLALNINTNTLCFVMNLALRYQHQSVHATCDNIMSSQWKTILSTEGFLEIDRATLEHIVQINGMSRNEKETFDACIKWAQKSCERKIIDATAHNLRAELGLCFSHIQFNRMSQSEFVECERSNRIFTFDEYRNIITNFTDGPKKTRHGFTFARPEPSFSNFNSSTKSAGTFTFRL